MLPCQLCGREVPIRTRIKSGENKDKKACNYCASKNKAKKVDYSSFFAKSIKNSDAICQNCGCYVNLDFKGSWNIAHILSKRTYPSVGEHLDNFVVLCSSKDNGNLCHEKFDANILGRENMPVFELALQKFVKFKDECLERGKEFYIFEEKI